MQTASEQKNETRSLPSHDNKLIMPKFVPTVSCFVHTASMYSVVVTLVIVAGVFCQEEGSSTTCE